MTYLGQSEVPSIFEELTYNKDVKPCLINFDKHVNNYLIDDHGIFMMQFSQWVNLILLSVFTPAFFIVAYSGYKLNGEVTFEVWVMIIAGFYDLSVIVSTFIVCDDFLVLLTEITSSSILLYMFYRFQ